MKKKLLSIASFVLLTTLSFAQNSATQPVSSSNQQQLRQRTSPTINVGSLQVQTNQFQNEEANGQHHCGSHSLNEAHYAERGILDEYNYSAKQSAKNISGDGLNKTPGVNEISVIFHVVHNPNNPAENVSNALIMQVFDDLTEDYLLLNTDAANARAGFTPANPGINFCLATQMPDGTPLTEVGVIRVETTEGFYDSDNGEENKMKSAATGGSEIWNRNDYLNVWICDITNGANSGTAGYAYRPTPSFLPGSGIDGIVIDYNLGVNNENVLTHEVGHYLGLDHTWGAGGCTVGDDDGFSDTPLTTGPSFNYAGSCSGSQQTCSGTETMYENYMDYSNCTVMFTEDQSNYMLSLLQGIRSSLLLSPGCDPVDAPPVVDFTADVADPIIIPVGGTVNFFSLATNSPTSWTWDFNGGATNSTDENPNVTFNTSGTYTVTHTATNSFGTGSETKTNHVQVVTASTGSACDTLRNYDPTNLTYFNVGSGYLWGNAEIAAENVLEWAEQYSATSATQVRGLEFAAAVVSDGGGDVIFKVYNDDLGVPGTVISSETVPIADITEFSWNNIEFSTPADVVGAFWVGYELSYNSTDTVSFFGSDGLSENHTFANVNIYGWNDMGPVFTDQLGHAFDILLSNGTAPTMDFTATTNEVCVDGEITVNGSISTDNDDYEWYLTDNPVTTIIETNQTSGTTFSFPTAGDYSIYLFGGGGCVTDAVLMDVTVNDAVAATLTENHTTCGNNDGVITVSAPLGGDGVNYEYSLDGVDYFPSGVFNNLAAGDYTVYVRSNGDFCETMYNTTINGSTTANASATPNTSVCNGSSVTLTATGGTSYVWDNGSSNVSNTSTAVVSPATLTTYNCLVTDAAGCQAMVQTTVTVTEPIAPTISASGSTSICSGTSITLTSSSATGNTWSDGSTSNTLEVSSAGSYTVSATDVNNCPATSVATVTTLLPSPVISTSSTNSPTTCGTSTGSIVIGGSGTGNVSWTGTESGTGTSVSLPYTISSIPAGSFDITFVDATGCTSNLLSESISDPTPPTTPVVISSGLTTICEGGTVTLTSSETGDLLWSNGETTTSITVGTTGNYSVVYTDAGNCSATSSATQVTVNPNPTAPIISASGSTTICENETLTLSSSEGSGNVWSNNATTQDISITATGDYSVVYTDGNGCTATSNTISAVVNALTPLTYDDLGTTCDYYAPIAVNFASPTGGTYSGTGVSGTTFDPAVTGTGSHTVTYSYTDANGCTNTAGAIIVVDACASIDENTTPVFSIVPNPISDNLNIIVEGEFSYTIFDSKGKKVANGQGNSSTKVNTTQFESGVYLINVTTENQTQTQRVIKH